METHKTLVTITNTTMTIFNTVNKVANITYFKSIQNNDNNTFHTLRKGRNAYVFHCAYPFLHHSPPQNTRKIKYYMECIGDVGHTDKLVQIDIKCFPLNYINSQSKINLGLLLHLKIKYYVGW